MSGPSEYQEGDVVRAKGGGPEMRVRLRAADLVYCIWFSGADLKTGAFDVNTLEKVSGMDDDGPERSSRHP